MSTMMFAFKIFFGLLLLFVTTSDSHKLTSKETVHDGSFQSRDTGHYKNGEHHNQFDHESILGSHEAAEQFDQLSPEEAKQKLKLLALKMDKNDDGFIDRKELTAWVLRSFKMLTEEEALDQLEDEDGNNDGKVTWEEHAAETYGIYDDDIIDKDKEVSEEYKMFRNDKQLFKAADVNKDGVLDKSEFSSFSHPEEFERMHQIVYDHTMEKRDLNADGFLSFEEFLSDNNGEQPNRGSENYILEKDRFEHDLDKNKDGKLSKDEVLLWIIPNNSEMAETEADHLIANSDDDKDGKLSIEELVSHHDVFVGSEATDFGEHLTNAHKFSDEL